MCTFSQDIDDHIFDALPSADHYVKSTRQGWIQNSSKQNIEDCNVLDQIEQSASEEWLEFVEAQTDGQLAPTNLDEKNMFSRLPQAYSSTDE